MIDPAIPVQASIYEGADIMGLRANCQTAKHTTPKTTGVSNTDGMLCPTPINVALQS